MTPNPKRILLVEDNRADAVLLQEMLMRDAPGQFDLCWVSSLRETLDRIERERFDAILLDLSLPDSHGLDTITRLCSAVPAMPILVITGVTDEQIANEAVRCGAADYLVKGHTEARSMVRAIRYAIDRKRAEEALQRAKTAAEEANQAKSRFLANVSHELRTPMNAILGMVELASHKVTDPTARDFLHTVKESADLLLTLLNDLLDCAKIEAGKLELESAPFSLPSIMDQVSRVLAVRASEKGLAFSCRIPPATPDSLVGDAVRLRQVLFNLAGNAVKFTERGEVEVSVRVAEEGNKGLGIGDWGLGEDKQPITADSPNLIPNPQSLIPPTPPSVTLEFSVRDTGIGIPPADLERIFQPFAQADASTTRRFGGTGLGLSICSNLVALMGGRIWVQSDVGQGST
ncbi:MAG: ATP-binding protein, partial [Thermoguttaceae bacterium]